MRLNATTNCSVVFARMTPRLAERLRGFSTQGNSTPRAASTGFSPRAMRLKRGTGTPAAARHWRIWNLSRAAATAAGALARSPRRSAMAAAAAAVTSSTPTTRSEERRVGEEWRSRWSPYHLKKKRKRMNAGGHERACAIEELGHRDDRESVRE